MNQRFIERIPNFSKVLVVAPAFYENPNKIAALEASRKKYKGWNVNYLGLGEKFKSYVEAKILAVQQYLELNKSMFEWAIILDSADTLLAREFIEHEIIAVLESFEKDVICGGETMLYPLSQLEGLFKSESLLKYLSSGVVAVRSTFVSTLFNYLLYLYRRFPTYAETETKKDASGNRVSTSDQIFYQLAYFSKKIGKNIALDEQGLLSVATRHIDVARLELDGELLMFENIAPFPKTAPYIYHMQYTDHEWRAKGLAEKLGIFLDEPMMNTSSAKA